ncbi:MAG TPA: DEAD/DEAH box helicase [Phycisphaerales bacterium]|nr:DEAD/DEAH box helicase [Phycisphaerales bacterium]
MNEPSNPSGPAPDHSGSDNRKPRRSRRRGGKPRGEGSPGHGSEQDSGRGSGRGPGERDSNRGEGHPAGGGHEGRPARPERPRRRPVETTPESEAAHAEIFDNEQGFETLGLPEHVMKGVREAGFKKPTLIQGKLIPAALAGKDVLGQAKTGTGKTASFGLPLLAMCDPAVPFQALVLAPTRELAVQIADELNELGRHGDVLVDTVMGGERISSQAQRLKKGASIIVGTPGRVMDMAERGLYHFNNVKFTVLDEVDRMLDIGFREDIRKILDRCPSERQTIFVSATIAGEIEKLARRFMRDPEKIVTTGASLTVNLVEQHYLAVQPWDKKKLLLHLLTHEEPAMTIVFCRLKKSVDMLAKYLEEKGIDVHAIHGDMRQGKRNRVIKQLREGDLTVLVASDLASRGIDAEAVSHVINYDLPEDPDLYVHRIGRTARAGRKGVAWSFVTPAQGELLTNIESLINREIPKMDYPDFTASPKPDSWRDESPGGQVFPTGPEAPKTSRFDAAVNPELPPAANDKVDASKFPGGIVPTKLPPKRMMGRIPSGRR